MNWHRIFGHGMILFLVLFLANHILYDQLCLPANTTCSLALLIYVIVLIIVTRHFKPIGFRAGLRVGIVWLLVATGLDHSLRMINYSPAAFNFTWGDLAAYVLTIIVPAIMGEAYEHK